MENTMSTMRINHMELTFPEGALTAQKKTQIGDFYQKLFDWNTLEIEIVDQKALLLMIDEEVSQFIFALNVEKPSVYNKKKGSQWSQAKDSWSPEPGSCSASP